MSHVLIKHTLIKAENSQFHLTVSSFYIKRRGSRSRQQKTCVTVLIVCDGREHVCERWWRVKTERNYWLNWRNVCVRYHYTNCATKSHTASV